MDSDILGDRDGDKLSEIEGLIDGDIDAEGLTDGDILGLIEGLKEGEILGDID